MSEFRGTLLQLRLMLRLQRWSYLIWPAVFAGLLFAMHDSFTTLYPTQADRDTYAALNNASPVLKAINGPGHGLDTPGGILVFEIGGYLLLLAAIIACLVVIGHTRKEEESGRAELTGSVPAGNLASSTAAMVGVLLFAVWTGAVVLIVLLLVALPFEGSLAYAASLTVIMIFFGSMALVAAQMSSRAGGAFGLAGAVVGLSYAVRAAGDVSEDSDLSWASPFGWVQAVRPFEDERWWPLGLAAGASLVLVAAGWSLRMRRDLGAGLLQPRPGPQSAARWLRGVWTVRFRELLGSFSAFGIIVIALAALFGVAGEEVTAVFDSGAGLGELLGMDEAGARDAYLSLVLVLLTLLVAAFGISASGRLRRDEQSGLAELELSTATPRWSWFLSTFVLTATAVVALTIILGTVLGGAYGAITDDGEAIADVLGAALHQTPATLLLVGVSLALYGWLPKAQPVSWAALGFCALVGLLAGPLQLDDAVIDASPYSHLPDLVEAEVGAGSAVVLALAAAMVLLGGMGSSRRDI